jgi:hypothetical protein
MNTYTIIGSERTRVNAEYMSVDPTGLGTFFYVGSEIVAIVPKEWAVIKQS